MLCVCIIAIQYAIRYWQAKTSTKIEIDRRKNLFAKNTIEKIEWKVFQIFWWICRKCCSSSTNMMKSQQSIEYFLNKNENRKKNPNAQLTYIDLFELILIIINIDKECIQNEWTHTQIRYTTLTHKLIQFEYQYSYRYTYTSMVWSSVYAECSAK